MPYWEEANRLSCGFEFIADEYHQLETFIVCQGYRTLNLVRLSKDVLHYCFTQLHPFC